jgi:hypothetical protein
LIVTAVIVVGCITGAAILFFKTKGKEKKNKFMKIATLSGIIVMAGGAIFISTNLRNNQNQVEDTSASTECASEGEPFEITRPCCTGLEIGSGNICITKATPRPTAIPDPQTACELTEYTCQNPTKPVCFGIVCVECIQEGGANKGGQKCCPSLVEKSGSCVKEPVDLDPTKDCDFSDEACKNNKINKYCFEMICVKCIPENGNFIHAQPCCPGLIKDGNKCKKDANPASTDCAKLRSDPSRWGKAGMYCSLNPQGYLISCTDEGTAGTDPRAKKCTTGCIVAAIGKNDYCKEDTPIKTPTGDPPPPPGYSSTPTAKTPTPPITTPVGGSPTPPITTPVGSSPTPPITTPVGGSPTPTGISPTPTGGSPTPPITTPVGGSPTPTGGSPTPTGVSPTPSIYGVECKPMDVDNNKLLNYIDLYQFIMVYNKQCGNDLTNAYSTACGAQDNNRDKKIDYIDFYALIVYYSPKVSDCSGMQK